MEPKQQFSIWYFLVAFPLILALQEFVSRRCTSTIFRTKNRGRHRNDAAMSMSSVSVVTNALRLRRVSR